MKIYSCREILQKTKDAPFYIYGAGGAALRVYNALKKKGLVENFLGFIVSCNKENQKVDGNIYVVSNKDLRRDINVFIVAHKVFLDEIIDSLSCNGFSKYEWIYPFMFELEYGEPVSLNKEKNTKNLVAKMRSQYMLAVYYLAIDSYLGKNDFGIDCHVKFHMTHVPKNTAERIAKLFCTRIENYLENKKIEPYPIMINSLEDYCMDGNHKLMLAYYFNVTSINCNIYNENDIILKLRTDNPIAIKDSYEEIRRIHTEKETLAILDVMQKLKNCN